MKGRPEKTPKNYGKGGTKKPSIKDMRGKREKELKEEHEKVKWKEEQTLKVSLI